MPTFPPPLFDRRLFNVCLALAVLAGQAGCEREGPASTAEVPAPVPSPREAEVLVVSPRPWPRIVRSQGVLIADEVAEVGAQVAGSVAEVRVDVGDRVRKGDPLVELDRIEFELRVQLAEAQLSQARSAVGLKPSDQVESLVPENAPPVRQEKALWDDAQAQLTRAMELKPQNVIAAAEYDQVVAAEHVAEARYAAALNAVYEKLSLIHVREVEVALARDRLENVVIVAPFDGFVQERLVAPGGYVQVGDRIATLVRTDPLQFRGAVPEHHAHELAVGQAVELRIAGVAEPRKARVTRISPALEQASRSLFFEAELANADQTLRTGLFAEAEVEIDPEAVELVVPPEAMVEFAGAQKVWKVVDDVASEQEVLVGQRRPEGVEIISGLTAGDVILRDASRGGSGPIRALAAQPARGTGEANAGEANAGEASAGEPGTDTPSAGEGGTGGTGASGEPPGGESRSEAAAGDGVTPPSQAEPQTTRGAP